MEPPTDGKDPMKYADIDWLLKRPIHHIGYVVDDIPTAIDEWQQFGVGPFVVVQRIEFEELHHAGEPCVFDHTAAFALYGGIGLELQQIFDAQPAAVAHGLGVGRSGNHVNHLAWACPDPQAASERLVEAGLPQFLYAATGGIPVRQHYAPFLNHAIEIHGDSEAMHGMWEMIRSITEGWDGTDPIRIMEQPRSE